MKYRFDKVWSKSKIRQLWHVSRQNQQKTFLDQSFPKSGWWTFSRILLSLRNLYAITKRASRCLLKRLHNTYICWTSPLRSEKVSGKYFAWFKQAEICNHWFWVIGFGLIIALLLRLTLALKIIQTLWWWLCNRPSRSIRTGKAQIEEQIVVCSYYLLPSMGEVPGLIPRPHGCTFFYSTFPSFLSLIFHTFPTAMLGRLGLYVKFLFLQNWRWSMTPSDPVFWNMDSNLSPINQCSKYVKVNNSRWTLQWTNMLKAAQTHRHKVKTYIYRLLKILKYTPSKIDVVTSRHGTWINVIHSGVTTSKLYHLAIYTISSK